MEHLLYQLNQELQKRFSQNNLRQLVQRKALIDFASNDYLGFSKNFHFKQKILDEIYKNNNENCFGATGSRLLTGNNTLYNDLETFIADFHGAEEGLIFNSGYTANLGLISAIIKPNNICIYDNHIHSSTHQGIILSKASAFPFFHNDTKHLQKRLSKNPEKMKFVFIESVYSCDGSLAPLKEIVDLCIFYKSYLIVDEAHATGIIGINGKGLVHEMHCNHQIFARIHTFSKALGAYGAIILGPSILKKYLINFCRPFIYTTALPISCLYSIKQAYLQLTSNEENRQKIFSLIHYFKKLCALEKLSLIYSETPIQSILIKDITLGKRILKRLEEKNILVNFLTSPTVKKNYEILRICIHSTHTKEQIRLLIKELTSILS